MEFIKNIKTGFKEFFKKPDFQTNKNVSSPLSGFNSSGYSKPSVFNWYAPQRSAKSQVTSGQEKTLVARAFDAYNNQDIARAIVTQLKTSVVSTGLKLNPNIDGESLGLTEDQEEELETKIISEFEIWSNRCDIERSLDFEDMQNLILVNWFVSGGLLINTLNYEYPGDIYSLKLQAIDIERLSNPHNGIDTKNLYRGIALNDFGAPTAYHILDAHPADMFLDPKGANTWTEIPAYDDMGRKRLLHVFEKDRIGAMKGYSGFATILERMKQVDRYADNELMASVVSSWLTMFIESENADDNLGFTKKEDDSRLGTDVAGKGKDSFELGPGAVVELAGGKKINMANPLRPNSNFSDYHETMTRLSAASIGLPLEEVLLLFKDSFSASRAANMRAGKTFTMKRQGIIKRGLEPIYPLFFDEAVFRGNLPYIPENYWTESRVRLAFQKHQWLGPGYGAIDELGQARASVERIKNNLSSLPEETAKLTGMNYKTVIRQQAKAMRMLERHGLPWPFDETKAETVKEGFINAPEPSKSTTIIDYIYKYSVVDGKKQRRDNSISDIE